MHPSMRFVLIVSVGLLISALSGSLPAVAQSVNLIPNPSFDNPQTCPTGWSTIGRRPGCGIPAGFAGDAPPWTRPGCHTGTSDVFNVCGTYSAGLLGTGVGRLWDMRVPNNGMGGQWPVSGTGYAGLIVYERSGEYREYIETPLTSPLVGGQRYRISFYVSLADKARHCVSSLGAYLSIGPTPAAYNYLAIPLTPQIQNTTGFLCDDTNWTLITGDYVALGGEDHITIGNFSPDAGLGIQNNPGVQGNNRLAYYYIDDVSVSCVCTAPPVVVAQPQHQIVPCGDPVTFSGDATGQCGVRYRWICDDCYAVPTVLSNNALFSGVTTLNLTLSSAAVVQFRNRTFRFEAYNDCGVARSNGATVDTIPLPILSQPSDLSICPPETATFTVAGTGAGLRYAWYWIPYGQTTPIPFQRFQGSHTPTLTFTTLSQHCGARVFCDVTGPCGTTRSREAVITCCPCATPPSTMSMWLSFDDVAPPGVTRNLLGGHNGVLMPLGSGPQPWTGVFAHNSLFFDGFDDYVWLRNHSLVDITHGDLTVDAWIFTKVLGSGVSVIVDKRRESGFGSTVGYHMFTVSDGTSMRLGFQLADGGFTNWVSSVVLPSSGAWSHVAVTIDRDDPSGGRFYINGAPAGTFDPTTRAGSMSNLSPLTVGARSTIPSGFFWGGIDEVEVFRRALTPSEIGAIYDAKAVGKCKLFVQAYPPTIYCADGAPTTIGAHVFNFTPATVAFSGAFFPLRCPTFTPPNLPVGVGPLAVGSGNWTTISASATMPPGMSPGDQACYTALIFAPQALPGFLFFQDQGVIVNRPDIHCGGGIATLVRLPLGAAGNVLLSFQNAGIDPGQFAWRVDALAPDGQPTRTLSLEGGEPGDPLFGDAFVPVGQSFELDLGVSFREAEVFGMTTLLLSTDTDADGVYEPATSASLICVAPAPCPGDANGDGQVNFADLSVVLSDFGAPGPGIAGDLNGDGLVDFTDLNLVLMGFGEPCE